MNESQLIEGSSGGQGTATVVAGLAAAALLTSGRNAVAATFADIPGTGNIKVLNYALALEDLEAELYAQAVQRLLGGGTGGGNASSSVGTIPGLNLSQSQRDVKFAVEFSAVEATHARYLRAKIGQLGGPVISPFKYDFGIQAMSEKQVIDLIFTAEKTGVMAYLGAIPNLDTRSNLTRTVIQIAGSIQGTEARHTAIFSDILRTQFGESIDVSPLPVPPFTNNAPFDNAFPNNKGIDKPQTPDSVLAAVSPFIKTS